MQLTLPYKNLAAAGSPTIRRSQYMWLLLVGYVYFFFNNFLLPDGFLYTFLLTPVFIYWMLTKKRPVAKGIFMFLLVWGAFLLVHRAYGVSLPEYL